MADRPQPPSHGTSTEDDYVGALRQAGLTVTAIGYPVPRDPSAWSTDEAVVSPCIVLTAVKAQPRASSSGRAKSLSLARRLISAEKARTRPG